MNWPQLEAHMNTQHYQVLTDGTDIGEEEIHYPVAKEIKIVPVIAGAGGSTGKILLGAALIGLAFTTGGASFAALKTGGIKAAFGVAGVKSWAFSVAALGTGLVLGGVTDLLFPLPKPPKFENDQDPRISFDFGGTPNTSRAGTTHPIVYGEIMTGSTVISMNLTTDQVTA